jgi:predicted peptidase
VYQSQDTPVDEIERQLPSSKSSYFLYVPSDYNPGQAYPLLVTLHGTHGFDDGRRQAQEWKALAEEKKFIVIAPQLLSPQGVWPVTRQQRMIDLEKDDTIMLSAMQEVKAKYHIADKAVAISSFSAGGYPMYYTALKHPELFTDVIAREADWDESTVKDFPVTDATRRLSIYIYFGKTGVNPLASQGDVLTRDSWRAFRYLNAHGCKKMKIQTISGSHERRPEVAWNWWQKQIEKRR